VLLELAPLLFLCAKHTKMTNAATEKQLIEKQLIEHEAVNSRRFLWAMLTSAFAALMSFATLFVTLYRLSKW